MSLLDRYVHAVSKHLPAKQQVDIAAELSDTLLSQLEAREAAVGRPLTEDEQAEVIKRFGHPLVAAGRYGSRQYLIGPELFPFYRFALKVTGWIVTPVVVFAAVVSGVTSNDPLTQLPSTVLRLSMFALASVAIVTLVFARIERMDKRFDVLRTWDPRGLPPVQDYRDPTPTREAIGSLVMMTFYLLWWIDALPLDVNRWLGGAPMPLELAPVWKVVSPAIVMLMAASIFRDVVSLVRPHWVTVRASSGLLLDAGTLLVLYRILRADALVAVTDVAARGLDQVFNMLLMMGLTALAGVVILFVGFDVHRLIGIVRSPARAASVS